MRRLLLIAIALCLAASSCKASNNGQTVAKVNGETISANRLALALKFELSKYDPKVADDTKRVDALKKSLLDEMIKKRILVKAAERSGVALTDSELSEFYTYYKSRYTEGTFQKMLEFKGINYDEWKAEKKREAIIEKFLEKELVSKIDVTDTEIKKYYKQHMKDFSKGDEVRARQILVAYPKLASELREKASSGENFASLAQEYSMAPEGKRGGDLGWFSRGIMPKAFDEACFPLPAGEISPVVKTEFGYHIFKVMERRGSHSVKLEDVKDKIVARIKQQKMEVMFDKWYDELEIDADIHINEDVLKNVTAPKEIK